MDPNRIFLSRLAARSFFISHHIFGSLRVIRQQIDSQGIFVPSPSHISTSFNSPTDSVTNLEIDPNKAKGVMLPKKKQKTKSEGSTPGFWNASDSSRFKKDLFTSS